MFPFLTFSAQGQDSVSTLMQCITVMIAENFSSLAILIFITIIVIPGFYLLSAIYIFVSLKSAQLLPGTHIVMKLIGHLQHWSMADIFLIGILVSFIKIIALADVGLGLSFWSYVFFIVSMTAAILHIDEYQVWQWIKEKENLPASSVPENGYYQGCHVCTEIVDVSKKVCETCGAHLHLRKKNSVQQTWALLITSVILYLPANLLPIMHTNFLGEETANTILGGVLVLWEHGSYPIALIIFIASVLVPVGKIIALGWLCYSIQTKSKKSCQQKTWLYRVTDLVGRWSMVDVFVVAVLVALIKLGNIMSIYPGWGALAFASMVIATVLAALSFDPRLIWDPINKEKV
tara:strand:+ start:2560 stop:3600 length:1041 start_codon:yes stop_codon:yes gene_type:complete